MATFLYFISPYLLYVLMYFFIRQLLPCQVSWGRMVVYLLPLVLVSVPKYLFGLEATITQVSITILFIVSMLVYPAVFFGAYHWKALLYALVLFAEQNLCDAVAYGIFTPYIGLDFRQYTATQMLVYALTVWAIYGLIASVSVLLLRAASSRRFRLSDLLYLTFPVSQVILIFCSIFNILNGVWMIGIVLSLGAELALLGYTTSQEKKEALEEELREIRHRMELEHVHYQAVEAQQEEIARIRHDFNNQLAAIGQLVRQGESGDAQHMIRQLSEEIGRTGAHAYCGVPVANAVLTEKARTCEEAGITLSLDLKLPPALPVEPTHLCSVFSNLLDNAIRGASASGVTKPVIRLTAAQEGGYLFIKTSNPAKPAEGKPEKGHGYGQKILRDLAARYSGDYHGEYENGQFTAVVALLAAQET